MLTMIKKETKKGMQLLETAKVNKGTTLRQVYHSWSERKENSFHDCLKKCNDEKGKDFHICSFNRDRYSVTWRTEKGIRIETGVTSYLIY